MHCGYYVNAHEPAEQNCTNEALCTGGSGADNVKGGIKNIQAKHKDS